MHKPFSLDMQVQLAVDLAALAVFYPVDAVRKRLDHRPYGKKGHPCRESERKCLPPLRKGDQCIKKEAGDVGDHAISHRRDEPEDDEQRGDAAIRPHVTHDACHPLLKCRRLLKR